jgi:rod shape-determining protein MreB
MAKKVWVLDTETKGTGANVVPLDSTLRRAVAPAEPLYVPPKRAPRPPEPPAPRPPRAYKLVDVTSGEVLAEDVDTRAAIGVLEGLGSVVDVRIYVWDESTEHWVLLTLGEHKALWDYRGKLAPESASRSDAPPAGTLRLMVLRSARDMAVDLGTANTVVHARPRIVLSEPSVVAIDERTGDVVAVGADAQRMIGRTPAQISATRPLRHGVIADFEVTEQMLRHFMRKVLDTAARIRAWRLRAVGHHRGRARAVEEAALSAARRVQLIEEPIAAAIGAGVAIGEPVGRMVIDVGGGTSEVAVISMGAIVLSRSVRVGGYDLDEAIGAIRARRHGDRLAERRGDQAAVGSAAPLPSELTRRSAGATSCPGSRASSSSAARRSARRRGPLRRSWRPSRPLEETPPGSPATSPATASCWPAAARSCAASRSASRPRPRSAPTWPSRR